MGGGGGRGGEERGGVLSWGSALENVKASRSKYMWMPINRYRAVGSYHRSSSQGQQGVHHKGSRGFYQQGQHGSSQGHQGLFMKAAGNSIK